jgi:hypothetical protein
MADLSPKAHTQAVLKRMNLAGSVPGNLDRNNDAKADNYGLTSAGASDASSFKLSGSPKAPHMGRPGRQSGGRISGDLVRTRRTPEETAKDIASEDAVVQSLAKDREGRAKGGRLGRWQGGPGRDVVGQKDLYATLPPEERPEGGFGPKDPIIKPYYNFLGGGLGTRSVGAPYGQGGVGSDATATPPRAKGGRIKRAGGGSLWGDMPSKDYFEKGGEYDLDKSGLELEGPRSVSSVVPGMSDDINRSVALDRARNLLNQGAQHKSGGRVSRAHGGRTGKGKTTVNVIIGGDKAGGQPPMPPPMAMPPPRPPMPPPAPPPPMAAPGPVGPPRPPMMPPGGAPMGPMGAPPPGAPPMLRARGGRIGRQVGGAMPAPAAPGQMGAGLPPPAAGAMPPGAPNPLAQRVGAPGAMPVMRARGGKIEISTPGVHDYGMPKHSKPEDEYGGGSGLGRQEKAKRQR